MGQVRLSWGMFFTPLIVLPILFDHYITHNIQVQRASLSSLLGTLREDGIIILDVINIVNFWVMIPCCLVRGYPQCRSQDEKYHRDYLVSVFCVI
jgi:hypothetical protein